MQPLYAPTHQGYVHLPYPQQQPMYVVMPIPDGQQHHQAYVPQQHNHQQPAYPTVSSNLLLHPILQPQQQAYHFATDGAYVMTPPGSEELQQFHGLPPATVRRIGGGPMPYYHLMSVPPPLSAATVREADSVTTPMPPAGPLHVGPMMGTARSPPQYQSCAMHSMLPSTPLRGLHSVVAVTRQSAQSTDNKGKLSPLMSNGTSNGTSAKKGRKQPQQPPPPPQQGCPPGGNLTDALRDLNGLQFRLGRWYEGTVKRYNPLRGFGFLTGTDALWVHTPDCEAVCAVSALEQEDDSPHYHEDGETKDASDSKELADTDTTGIVEENEVTTTAKQKTKETRHIIRQGGTTQLHGVVVPSTMQWYLQNQSQSGRLQRIPMPTLGDIFVHHSCISMNGFRVLPVGRAVRFSVAVLMGTVQAVDVVPLNASWWVPSSLTAMPPPAVDTAAGDTVERETAQSTPESSLPLLDSPPPPPSPALPTTAVAMEEVVTAVPLAAHPPSCAVPAAARAVIRHRLRVAPPEKAAGSITEDNASDSPSAASEKSAVTPSLENSPLSAVDDHFDSPTVSKGYLDRLAVIPSAAVPNAVEARSELLIVRVRQLKSLDLVEAAATAGGNAESDSLREDEGAFRGGWETPTGASLEKALQQLGVAHSDIYSALKEREWGAKTTATAGNASAMHVTSEADGPPDNALHPTMICPTGGEGARPPRPIPQHRDISEVEEGNTGPSARTHQTPLRSAPGEYLCSRLPFLQECSSVGDLVTAPRHTLPPTLATQFSSDDPVGTLLRSAVSDGKSAHNNTSNLDCDPKRSTGGKTCSATFRDTSAGTPVYEARGSSVSPQRMGGNISDVKQRPQSPSDSPPRPHTPLESVGVTRKSVSRSYSGTPDRCQAASVPAAVSLSSPRGTETGGVPDPLSTGGTARGTCKPSSGQRLATPNEHGGYHDTSLSSREAPSGQTTAFSPQLAESSLSTILHIHEVSTNNATSPTSQAGNLYFSMQYVMSTPDENLSPIPMELLRLGGMSNSSLSHLQSSD